MFTDTNMSDHCAYTKYAPDSEFQWFDYLTSMVYK